MLFWMIVKVAFKSLMANKLRSILAMLGIIIGVAAVIAMLAIGTGAKQQVLDRISAMGTNLLYPSVAARDGGRDLRDATESQR
jgi:ABC-type antimicrobial peptide transport system permease subunit